MGTLKEASSISISSLHLLSTSLSAGDVLEMYFSILCAIVCVVLLLIYDSVRPKHYPPGPRCLPIIGNLIYFRRKLKLLGYIHLVWENLRQTYGNVVGIRIGRDYIVTVFGAEAVKEVLTRDEFNGRPDGFFFRLRTFGKRLGVVFSDGGLWKKQRKFSLQNLKHFGLGRREMENRIEIEAHELVSSLQKKCFEPIVIHNTFDISVVNVLWCMMAGERFALEDARLERLFTIIHDAFRAVDISGGLLNQLPLLRYISPDFCGYTAVINTLENLWAFLEETIEEHRKTVCKNQARDLIDAFLIKMDVKDDGYFTDDQLMSLCLDLFMAGSETTGNTLTFSVIYMLLYPDVQRKVQAELDEVIGKDRQPSLCDRNRLPYTEAVIMEVQRIANIPPLGISHRALCDTTLLGYDIPEDTIILASLYSIHMDKSFWKDPEVFRPERFFDETGKICVDESYFAPFSYGKRRCLGEHLAKANMFMFFTALLHNFYLECAPDGPQPDVKGYDGVVISPKPFKCILISR